MKASILAAVATASVTMLFASAAMAEEAAPAAPAAAASTDGGSGISLALRVGYALPMGDSSKNVKMSDSGYKAAIPFTFDAIYKFSPSLGAGIYASYAVVSLDKDKNAADSASWLKYGAQLRYYTGDLFLGYGIGLEKVTAKAGGGDASVSGLELAHLIAGYNFYKADKLKVGAFGDFSYGQYSSVEFGGNSADINEKAAHEWLYFGLNGQYDL